MVKRIALVLIVAASSAGCGDVRPPAAEAVVGSSNPAYRVERLFTDADGHTVYRFRDRGQDLYYVAGPGGPQMVPPPTRPAGVVAPPPVEPN